MNTSRAPVAIDPVPPVIAPETPPGKTAAGALSLQEEFVGAAERWLDAYYRRDRNAMAAFSDAQLSVSDERTENERLPQGLAGVRRSLEDVNLQLFGESAIFTAKMTERWENIAVARMATSDSFRIADMDASRRHVATDRRAHRKRLDTESNLPLRRGAALLTPAIRTCIRRPRSAAKSPGCS